MIGLSQFDFATSSRLNLNRRTGVYFIRNKITDALYIGSAARNFWARWHGHKNALIVNAHQNIHLQRAWNMYGKHAFEFGVIEDCSPEHCVYVEQKWISFLKPEYNIHRLAGSARGMVLGENSRRKISEDMKLYCARPDVKLRKSMEKKGVRRSPDICAKISIGLKGHTVSSETGAKISAANKGKPKFRLRGQKRTEETRAKMSAAKKGRPATEAQLACLKIGWELKRAKNKLHE